MLSSYLFIYFFFVMYPPCTQGHETIEMTKMHLDVIIIIIIPRPKGSHWKDVEKLHKALKSEVADPGVGKATRRHYWQTLHKYEPTMQCSNKH